MREIGRLVVVLVLICSFSAASLSFVRTSLADRIERQSDFYVRGPALARLFRQPADELLANKIVVASGDTEFPVFYQREDGRVTGLAVEAAGKGGYGGDIVIMVGVDLGRQSVLGVEIVSHSETPGLGARVQDGPFRKQWVGMPLAGTAALTADGGQVDAITGATFSSRAMMDGTNQVLDLLHGRTEEILAEIPGR